MNSNLEKYLYNIVDEKATLDEFHRIQHVMTTINGV